MNYSMHYSTFVYDRMISNRISPFDRFMSVMASLESAGVVPLIATILSPACSPAALLGFRAPSGRALKPFTTTEEEREERGSVSVTSTNPRPCSPIGTENDMVEAVLVALVMLLVEVLEERDSFIRPPPPPTALGPLLEIAGEGEGFVEGKGGGLTPVSLAEACRRRSLRCSSSCLLPTNSELSANRRYS